MPKFTFFILAFFPVWLNAQSFYYNVRSILYYNKGTMEIDSTMQATDPAQGILQQEFSLTPAPGVIAETATYCSPTGTTGIRAKTQGGGATPANANSGNRFYNENAHFQGTNGQNVPVEVFFSLDGTLNFSRLSFSSDYCGGAAEGAICLFLDIDSTSFSSCSQVSLSRNRLFCLNCLFHKPDYLIRLKPKLLLTNGDEIALPKAFVDNLLAYYKGLSPAQIAADTLSMSVNFIDYLNTFTYGKSDFFNMVWIKSSTGYESYLAFERLIKQSGQYQSLGMTTPQKIHFAIDYSIELDIRESLRLNANADPFTIKYLFYSDNGSSGPCQTRVESNFINTFKIDSVRVAKDYYNSSVDFDNLKLVIAPGVSIKVKSDFSTLPTHQTLTPAEISVSPNPTSDFISIRSLGGVPLEQIVLVDQLGRVCATARDISSLQYQLDASRLPAGIYRLSIHLDNGAQVVKRIVKQ